MTFDLKHTTIKVIVRPDRFSFHLKIRSSSAIPFKSLYENFRHTGSPTISQSYYSKNTLTKQTPIKA